jgi:glutathionylspermidine synthase
MAWSGVPWRRLALGSAPPLLLLVDAYVIGPRAAKHAADAEPGDTTHLSRVHVAPRPDWRERIKGQRDPRTGEPGDFQYGELDGTFWARDVWARAHAASGGWLPAMGATDAYWNESAAYATSAEGMWQVESAAYELHSMCLEAVAEVVESDALLLRFGVPEPLWEAVRVSWRERQPDLAGRFDLLWDGEGAPKLAEYNADTPTVLVESARPQREWLEDVVRLGLLPTSDAAGGPVGQFNALDASFERAFRAMAAAERARYHSFSMVFTAQKETDDMSFVEERGTARYVMARAAKAGLVTSFVDLEDFERPEVLRNLLAAGASDSYLSANRQYLAIWKLYPYEWLVNETLGRCLQPPCLDGHVKWLEPAWKLVAASKAILPFLWARHPGHPNLLPAFFTAEELQAYEERRAHDAAAAGEAAPEEVHWVGKPRWGREGNGIVYSNCDEGNFGSLGAFSAAAEIAAMGGDASGGALDRAKAQAVETITDAATGAAAEMQQQLGALTGAQDRTAVSHLLDHAYGGQHRHGHPAASQHPPVGPPVFQQFHAPARLHGRSVVTSAWVVRGEPAGACFREDNGKTTNNDSCFVPHFVRPPQAGEQPPAPRVYTLSDRQRRLRTELYGGAPPSDAAAGQQPASTSGEAKSADAPYTRGCAAGSHGGTYVPAGHGGSALNGASKGPQQSWGEWTKGLWRRLFTGESKGKSASPGSSGPSWSPWKSAGGSGKSAAGERARARPPTAYGTTGSTGGTGKPTPRWKPKHRTGATGRATSGGAGRSRGYGG